MILTILFCKRTLALLDSYVDHELSPREEKGVRLHLAICHACEEKFAFETRFIQAMRGHLASVVALEESTNPSRLRRLREAHQVLDALEPARSGAPGE
jgi:anti-sigma factor RsiW